ncbi:MAG: PilZ domain-containing protein, partial [Elusimicrobia bacterium]|nr:PilZ domain-containing protein [Elusimicrobiota bacterium]
MWFEERRKFVRVFYVTPVTFLLSSGQKVEGVTEDISLGGLKFSAESELSVGDKLSGKLRFPDGGVYLIEGTICGIREETPRLYRMIFS